MQKLRDLVGSLRKPDELIFEAAKLSPKNVSNRQRGERLSACFNRDWVDGRGKEPKYLFRVVILATFRWCKLTSARHVCLVTGEELI